MINRSLASRNVESGLLCSFFSDDFDPVLIADKLKRIADELDNDVMFQAALSDFKKAVALEVSTFSFLHPVTPTGRGSTVGVQYKMQLARYAHTLVVVVNC